MSFTNINKHSTKVSNYDFITSHLMLDQMHFKVVESQNIRCLSRTVELVSVRLEHGN